MSDFAAQQPIPQVAHLRHSKIPGVRTRRETKRAVWQERASEFPQGRLITEFAPFSRKQTVRRSSPILFRDEFVGLICGRLELRGVSASRRLVLSNLFAYSSARQRSCTPLGLSLFFGPITKGDQFLRKEHAHYCVIRFSLMIPAGLPQATIKELLRHNNQFMRRGKQVFE